MPELVRKDPEHEYFLDGVKIRGVNEVVDILLQTDKSWFSEWHRDRGSLVHAAIALDIAGDLVEETLDPELRPFVEARRLFARETGWVSVHVERPIWSKELWTAGTPDDVGYFPKPGRRRVELLVNDYKTGAEIAPYKLATAGYALLAEEFYGEEIHGRFCTHLQQDGRYKLRFHKHERDKIAFRGLAHATAWRDHETGNRRRAA